VDKKCPPVLTCADPALQNPKEYFAAYERVLANLPYSEIDKAIGEIMAAYERGASIFTFGNGGSAALASHLMTAWANDHCYDQIFAQQLQNFVVPGDLAFAISGSGNSANVLRGLELAREHGARTLGLAGFQGGKMKALCDICVILPSDNMQIIEDFHLSVTHAISCALRQKVFQGVHTQEMSVTGMAD
jgi:D-sedoheptulose 7-phosphate isomerase